jgi:prophage regulatory protein
MDQRLLRRPEVERLVGLSRSTIYAMMRRGEFPLPVRLSARAVAWRRSDLDDWLARRPIAMGERDQS